MMKEVFFNQKSSRKLQENYFLEKSFYKKMPQYLLHSLQCILFSTDVNFSGCVYAYTGTCTMRDQSWNFFFLSHITMLFLLLCVPWMFLSVNIFSLSLFFLNATYLSLFVQFHTCLLLANNNFWNFSTL
jgi:hypothetical protein